MAYYRIYLLDAANRISGVQEAECGSDQNAVEIGTLQLSRWPSVEVWQYARRVAKLLPEQAKAAFYAVL